MKELNSLIKVYKLHGIGISNDDPLGKTKSTLVIITNLKLRFELCVFNLIRYDVQKIQKKNAM
jgi:hypothetical protein